MRYANIRRAGTGILAAGLVGLATGCVGEKSTTTATQPPVAAVELSAPATVLEAGKTLQLAASARDGSGATLSGFRFSWSSSRPNVATVSDQGVVRGLTSGAATITASAGSRSATLDVSVRDTTTLSTTPTGSIERLNVTFAAGQTYRIASDVVVRADSNLKVEGKIELDPGVTAIFFAGGTLDLSGQIGPAPITARSAALRAGGAGAGPGSTVLAGQRLNINTDLQVNGPIYLAGANTGQTATSVVTIGPNVTLGPLRAPDGTAQARDGQTGYDLEIGTGIARNKLGPLGQYGGPIKRLQIFNSTVSGGTGGTGYTLTRADGSITNNRWNGTAGRGGNGGILAITADELQVVGSLVVPGSGGHGGVAVLTSGDKLADGSGPNGEGESLLLTAGLGGDAGALEILSNLVVTADRFREGAVGETGEPNVQGGNGRNGGSGGDLTIRMGEPGKRSRLAVPTGIAVELPSPPTFPLVLVADAANGGDATVPGKVGGTGGTITVEGPLAFSAPKAREIRLTRVAKGGRGFNGCLPNPVVNGTDGGDGGRLRADSVTVTSSRDFNGGAGGDGMPNVGAGGVPGTYLGLPFGLVGARGSPCPGLLVLPQSIGIVYDVPTGQCQDDLLASGNITIKNQTTTAASYTVNVVNLQGNSGIGVFPNLSSIGSGVSAVSGTAPANGQHVVWYKFYPCVARDGGGNAKAELQISAGIRIYTIPVTVTTR